MSVLDVNDVRKRYGHHTVLDGASLDVQPGEIVGLTGENGAGKSTLLKIIVGLLQADAGTITCPGRLGYCPQDSVLFDALTMHENLTYFAAGYGLAPAALRERSQALCDRLRCREYAATRVSQLSGGTRQKLNLIVAMLNQPSLVILDEPYQGFDYDSYLAFWDLAEEFKRAGRSVLIVSHLLIDRDRLDRVYTMRNGLAVREG
jgi:ABC-2 type transport system ATP-binding protein